MILDNINGPKDIKQLNREELHILADETRHYILQKVSEHGGHIGPNLGIVDHLNLIGCTAHRLMLQKTVRGCC